MILSPSEDNMIAMAVANLFKHKIRFPARSSLEDDHYCQNTNWRVYKFLYRSINVTDVNELRLKCLEPFVIHIISSIMKEKRYYINEFLVEAAIHLPSGCNQDWVKYILPDPNENIRLLEIRAYQVPEKVMKGLVHIEFFVGYDFTPPSETYREDCCVVCLEAKPNILYLDCKHIAICDSCDRLKKTGRDNCDVCRAEISERIKI